MTVYDLIQHLQNFPPTHRVIYCVGTGGSHPDGFRADHWFDELRAKDINPGPEKDTILLSR